jgi:hypothetical protein
VIINVTIYANNALGIRIQDALEINRENVMHVIIGVIVKLA